MALKNLNGEFPPSATELSYAPAALDPIPLTPRSGENGNHTKTSNDITPETLAREARKYRRATATLEGGDRDKYNALIKRANRIRHALQARNLAGLLGPMTAFRTEVMDRPARKSS